MTIEFRLPPLPDTGEVSIGRWLKEAGDPIQLNQVLLQVYSNRFDWDIPAASAGTLEEIRAPAGARVRPGDVLAVLSIASSAKVRAHTEQPSGARQAETRISPIAARIAGEHALDLAHVQGSGAYGRITKQDVLALVDRQTASPGVETQACESLSETTPAGRARAERLSRRRQAVPHVSSFVEVDIGHVRSQIERQQQAWLAREGFALQETPFVVLAAVAALLAVPTLNSAFAAEGIVQKNACHIALLGASVIAHAEVYNLVGIARRVHDSARADSPAPTFTIDARGLQSGAQWFTGVVPDGQAAILGIGATQAHAVVVDERLVVHPVVYVSLTYDHRVVDGIVAGEFLSFLKAGLESNSIQGV